MTFRPLYYFSKLLFNVTIRTYYRHIKVRGEENLCPGKPVIIAMNHPNAFMDPIAFATVIGPEMNFLARGDVFTKWLTPILKGVGIIPIYRLIDSGREGVQKNDETFKIVTQYLKDRRYVIIFAEGISLQGRRLGNLKKGCARIVLGAMETLDDNEILIVPVGMNYQNNPSKFRHRLFIDIGKPLTVKDYRSLYSENPAKGVNVLTSDLQKRMSETIVCIADKSNDSLIENIEEIYMEEFLEKQGQSRKHIEGAHNFSLSITDKINKIYHTHPEKVDTLKSSIELYISKLKSYGIRDKLLRDKFLNLSQLGSVIFRTLTFVFLFPLWIVGLITNYVPYFICWKSPAKFTKDIEWYAAISGVVGSFVFLLYHLLQFTLVGLFFKDTLVLTSFISITLLSGWFSLHFSPFRKKLLGSIRLYRLRKNNTQFQLLLESRRKIIDDINKLLN
ncbi:MAG: 1-acyl-sn-glycerol-3-phosphate acyltransferase [Bacteroidota bacterium]